MLKVKNWSYEIFEKFLILFYILIIFLVMDFVNRNIIKVCVMIKVNELTYKNNITNILNEIIDIQIYFNTLTS